MIGRAHTLRMFLACAILLTITLSACTTETIEVTRIKILERRVIERVLVTVEVTRIHRLVETPRPTLDDMVPLGASATPQPSPSPPTATVTPALPGPTSAATPVPSGKQVGEQALAAIKDAEQTLLSLIQALNSDPLPTGYIIELYDTLRAAPSFSVPEGEAELQSAYVRYREQVEQAVERGTDLYTHMVKIQSGEAAQTEINPTHLSLARDAASAGTSGLQGLIRELEAYLASQP
jgi:hypothetical protein